MSLTERPNAPPLPTSPVTGISSSNPILDSGQLVWYGSMAVCVNVGYVQLPLLYLFHVVMERIKSFGLFLCGFAAVTFSKSACHPPDVVTIRFQVTGLVLKIADFHLDVS
jgi:hypothetical protein